MVLALCFPWDTSGSKGPSNVERDHQIYLFRCVQLKNMLCLCIQHTMATSQPLVLGRQNNTKVRWTANATQCFTELLNNNNYTSCARRPLSLSSCTLQAHKWLSRWQHWRYCHWDHGWSRKQWSIVHGWLGLLLEFFISDALAHFGLVVVLLQHKSVAAVSTSMHTWAILHRQNTPV